jgi:TetR/AcrR family transcriptional regulator, cholesterol catabolism regulator
LSERREEIVALAGEMFASKGFVSTTVREIADAAGILSGSLYHHFESKESIVDELLARFLDDMLTGYRRTIDEGDDPVLVLRELIRQAFLTMGPNRAAVAVMQTEFNHLVQFPRFAYLRDAAEAAERLWVGVLAEGIRVGAFRSEIDPVLAYRFIRDAVWVTVRWYRPDGRYSLEQIGDAYLDVLLRGITTARASRRLVPVRRRAEAG